LTVQNVSLPEELQKILDQKIGMGMVGNDMGKFMQYQTAQAIPNWPKPGRAAAWRAMPWAWAPAWRWARCWRRTCRPACRAGAARRAAAAAPAAAAAAGRQADDVMATLEKLGELKAKGILTQEEFDAKKAELLKSWSETLWHSCLLEVSARGQKPHSRSARQTPPHGHRPTHRTLRALPRLRRAGGISAQSTHAVCGYCQSTVVPGRGARASARWPSCSTTTALLLMASGRARRAARSSPSR
jgi:hypothetical protein